MGTLRYIAEHVSKTLPLARTALHVRRTYGKPISDQVQEMVALHRGPGRLKPFDYYAYELYDDRRYSFAEKGEFVSWLSNRLRAALNDPAWDALGDDKLIAYTLFGALGLDFPEVQAFHHPGNRTCGSIPALRTAADIAAFLREDARYPIFGKPVHDSFGRGASSLVGFDRARDVVQTEQGEEWPVERYVADFPVACVRGVNRQRADPPGYLFQSRVVQHPLVDRLSGGRIGTVRLIVLLGPEGARLHRVTWKLPVGRNITDHAIGTSGNIKCSVDPASGEVERVVQGPGPEGFPVYAIGAYGRPVEHHPDTGQRLSSLVLPNWERVVAECLRAATSLPGLRYQGWDIALGPHGPVFLECNPCSGIAQVAGCRGFYDDACRALFGALGVVPKAPPVERRGG